jgi:hypothetical protein
MHMKKRIRIGAWLLAWALAGLTGCAGTVTGQSLFDATGNKIASKTGENTYNITGGDYVLRNGNLIRSFGGELREDMGVYYYLLEDGRMVYYNVYDQRVGYYVPASRRFVRIEPGSDKESEAAVVLNGEVFTQDKTPTYRFENGFEMEMIGFILFFFMG